VSGTELLEIGFAEFFEVLLITALHWRCRYVAKDMLMCSYLRLPHLSGISALRDANSFSIYGEIVFN
jgi:hypothetical protein